MRKGKAHFPAKSVHEQIVVEGKVGWLQNDLIHMADTTFKRYLERNNRYIKCQQCADLWQVFLPYSKTIIRKAGRHHTVSFRKDI